MYAPTNDSVANSTSRQCTKIGDKVGTFPGNDNIQRPGHAELTSTIDIGLAVVGLLLFIVRVYWSRLISVSVQDTYTRGVFMLVSYFSFLFYLSLYFDLFFLLG